jgi:hypothetical protein
MSMAPCSPVLTASWRCRWGSFRGCVRRDPAPAPGHLVHPSGLAGVDLLAHPAWPPVCDHGRPRAGWDAPARGLGRLARPVGERPFLSSRPRLGRGPRGVRSPPDTAAGLAGADRADPPGDGGAGPHSGPGLDEARSHTLAHRPPAGTEGPRAEPAGGHSRLQRDALQWIPDRCHTPSVGLHR